VQLAPHVAVVYPANDWISHDHADPESCVCGPEVEPVPCRDGSMSWLFTHHSLDGRELSEGEQEK
jgi:hypothetical protein